MFISEGLSHRVSSVYNGIISTQEQKSDVKKKICKWKINQAISKRAQCNFICYQQKRKKIYIDMVVYILAELASTILNMLEYAKNLLKDN